MLQVRLSSSVEAGFTIGESLCPYDYRSLKQTHGIRGFDVDLQFQDRSQEGDWLMTADSRVALGIRVADCTAILAHGLNRGQSMVLAAHAGWRGTAAGILGVISQKLAAWESLELWLSPSISQTCFEVGPEVIEALGEDAVPFAVAGKSSQKFYLNLKGLQESRLQKVLPRARIRSSSLCTYLQPDFYSYRRAGSLSQGRHLAWIKIRA